MAARSRPPQRIAANKAIKALQRKQGDDEEDEAVPNQFPKQPVVATPIQKKKAPRKKKKIIVDEKQFSLLGLQDHEHEPSKPKATKKKKSIKEENNDKDADEKHEAEETEPKSTADPVARKWLHGLEPKVQHLGGASYRVHSLLHFVDQQNAHFLQTTANITLSNLARSILTRSRILTILGEDQRKELHKTDPTFRPSEPFPMLPVRGHIPHHRVLTLKHVVKIGEDNLYCLLRMQGDRCVYDTFIYIDDVIVGRMVEKKDLWMYVDAQPPSFENIDWLPLQM